ncbi:hypothetical protein ACFFRR_011827 [Megaselia abdita]
MQRKMNILIIVVVLLCSVLADNVSESENSNGTVREARQIRFVSYDNGRPKFGPGPPQRIMPRIGNNGMQKFNNHPPGLPPNMMIRRRVQSLPTSMIMKGKNPRINMPKPHNIVNSRPQVVKPYPRGPPPKQFFPAKLPSFSKAQVSAAENKFKASVPFNGNVIVKAAPPPSSSSDYKYETPAANSIRPNGLQSEKGYSVYEVTDDLTQQKPVFNFPKAQPQQPQQVIVPQPTSSLQSQYQFYQSNQQQQQQQQMQQKHHQQQSQYHQTNKQVSTDEAKRYMSFMGSNQYFLPKSEPDYRKMPTASPSEEVKFYDIRKQQLKTVVPTTPVLTYYNTQTESSSNAKFNYPVHYYTDEGVSGNGGNSKSNFKSPPPERFEFTENDAIHGTYTSSPVLKTYESEQEEIFNNLNRRHSQDQDQEDKEDDMEDYEESDPSYSRVKIDNKKTDSEVSSSEPVKTDAKTEDTEDYCERICSNVHDDDEQVICGSDGYMYTSEAQLECYSSCLHIEVTIQGKGSCS